MIERTFENIKICHNFIVGRKVGEQCGYLREAYPNQHNLYYKGRCDDGLECDSNKCSPKGIKYYRMIDLVKTKSSNSTYLFISL